MPEQENTSSNEQTQTTTEQTSTDTTLLGGNADTTTQSDDLSTLFTPEEVTAKKEAATAKVAEEARRATLTDEQRTAEDAAKAEADKLNTIPEEYAFTVPDGGQLDTELMAKVVPVFKDLGLTQAKANQLTDLFSKEIIPSILRRQEDAWKIEVTSWAEATKKDPEIGGTKFDTTIEKAARALNTINPALKETLDKYGFGNHPEMIRTFAKVADMMSEDSISQAKKNEQSGKTVAERMFPGLPLN